MSSSCKISSQRDISTIKGNLTRVITLLNNLLKANQITPSEFKEGVIKAIYLIKEDWVLSGEYGGVPILDVLAYLINLCFQRNGLNNIDSSFYNDVTAKTILETSLADQSVADIMEMFTSTLLTSLDEVLQQVEANTDFIDAAFGYVGEVRSKFILDSNRFLVDACILNRNSIPGIGFKTISSNSDLDENLRLLQEYLFNNIISYLQKYVVPNNKESVFLSDDIKKLIRSGNIPLFKHNGDNWVLSDLYFQLQDTIEHYLLIGSIEALKELSAKSDPESKAKVEAYRSYILFEHFDSYIATSPFGKIVNIDNFGIKQGNKYSFSPTTALLSKTWRVDENINIENEADSVTKVLITTTPIMKYGTSEATGRYLTFNDFSSIISKLKISSLAHITTTIDFNSTSNAIEELFDSLSPRTVEYLTKCGTLSKAINMLNDDPIINYPAIFELLTNPKFKNIRGGDTVINQLFNSDERDKLYSLGVGLFSRLHENSIAKLQNPLGRVNFFNNLLLQSASIYDVTMAQYFVENGIINVRALKDYSIYNIRKKFETTINLTNIAAVKGSWGDFINKYDITFPETGKVKFKVPGSNVYYTVDYNYGNVTADGTVNDEIAYNFIESILHLGLMNDATFKSIAETYEEQLKSKLLGMAARVLVTTIKEHELLTTTPDIKDIETTVETVFKEAKLKYDRSLESLTRIYARDVPTLHTLAKAKAEAKGLSTAAQSKDSEANGQSNQTNSRLLGTLPFQIDRQERASNSATRNCLFVSKPNLFLGYVTDLEYANRAEDTSKKSIKMSVSEMTYISFVHDFIGGMIPRPEDKHEDNLFQNGVIGVLASVNSDKTTITKARINIKALGINSLADLLTYDIDTTIRSELFDIYSNIFNEVSKDWQRVYDIIKLSYPDFNVNVAEDIRNNFKLLNRLFYKQGLHYQHESVYDWIRSITLEYNTKTRFELNTEPIDLVDQQHFKVREDGTLMANRVLLFQLAKYDPNNSRVYDRFIAEKRFQLIRSLLKSNFELSTTKIDLPEIATIVHTLGPKWISKANTMILAYGKVNGKVVEIRSISQLNEATELEINPLLDAWNKVNFLFSQESLITGVGSFTNHPNKVEYPIKKASQIATESNVTISEERLIPWGSDPSRTQRGHIIYLNEDPSKYIQLTREVDLDTGEENGRWVIHFKTGLRVNPGDPNSPFVRNPDGSVMPDPSFTDGQKQRLFKVAAAFLDKGVEVSTFGTITKGGLAGLNRLLNLGYEVVGTRQIENAEIPILRKTEDVGQEMDNETAYQKAINEEAQCTAAQNKRNVSWTAQKQLFLPKLLNGAPSEYNIAVVEDIHNMNGLIHGKMDKTARSTPFDGATFQDPFSVHTENASLNGNSAGVTKKTFVHAKNFKIGGGIIIKTAVFGMSNFWLRGSEWLMHLMKKMTDIQWRNQDGSIFNDNIFLNFEDGPVGPLVLEPIYWRAEENGQWQYYTANVIGRNENGEYVQEVYKCNERGEPTEYVGQKAQTITSNYQLWEFFGGKESMSVVNGTLEPSEASVLNVVAVMNNVGTVTSKDGKIYSQSDYYQPLKHSMVHYVVTGGAIKQGAANVNSNKVFDLDNNDALNTFKIQMYDAGIQLDKEHHADDEDISLLTQVIAACALRGYTFDTANQLYNVLKDTSEIQLGNLLEAAELEVLGNISSEEFRAVVIDKLLDIFSHLDAVNNLASSIAKTIVAKIKSGEIAGASEAVLPLSDSSIYRKFVSAINSYITNSGIKLKLPGVLAMLTPSYNIMKLYDGRLISSFKNPAIELLQLQEVYRSINLAQNISQIELGRSYNVVWKDPTKGETTEKIITPDDYYKLKNHLGEIDYIYENVTEGRELAAYNARFTDLYGNQWQLWDLDSAKRLWQLNAIKKTKNKAQLQTVIRLLLGIDIEINDFDTVFKHLMEEAYRQLQYDLLNLSSLETDPLQLFNTFLSSYIGYTTDPVSGNRILQVKDGIERSEFYDKLARWINIKLENGRGNKVRFFNGTTYVWTEINDGNFESVLEQYKLNIGNLLKVSINGRKVKIDRSSVKIQPYEIILPKVFQTVFGLDVNSDLAEISKDENYFIKQHLAQQRTWLSADQYTIELKRPNGKHIYVLLSSELEKASGLELIRQIPTKLEGDHLYKLDSKQRKEYELSSPSDRVFRTVNNREVIVTDNLDFYINNLHYDSVRISRSMMDEEHVQPLQGILRMLRDSSNRSANYSFKNLTHVGKVGRILTLALLEHQDVPNERKVYVGEGTEFANPFSSEPLKAYTAKEATELYERWLLGDKDVKSRIIRVLGQEGWELLEQRRLTILEHINNGDLINKYLITDSSEIPDDSYTKTIVHPATETTEETEETVVIKEYGKDAPSYVDVIKKLANLAAEKIRLQEEDFEDNSAIAIGLVEAVYSNDERIAKLSKRDVDERFLNDPRNEYIVKMGRAKHASFLKQLEVLAARVPSQSMQSFMPMKIVAFESRDVNNAYVSTMQILLQGSDYDIDAVSIQTYDIDRNGTLPLWSPYANILSIDLLNASMTLPYPTKKKIEFKEINGAKKVSALLARYTLGSDTPLFTIRPKTVVVKEGDKIVGERETNDVIIDVNINTVENIMLLKQFLLTASSMNKPTTNYMSDLSDILYERRITSTRLNEHLLLSLFKELENIVNRHNMYLVDMKSDSKKIRIANNQNTFVIYQTISNPVNLIQSLMPVDDCTQEVKDLTALSPINDELNTRTAGNTAAMFEQINDNSLGKEDIGISAIGLKTFSGCTHYYNTVLNMEPPVKITPAIIKALFYRSSKGWGLNSENLAKQLLSDAGIKNKEIQDQLYQMAVAQHRLLFDVTISGKRYLLVSNVRAMDPNTIIHPQIFKILSETPNNYDTALRISALIGLSADNAKELLLAKLNANSRMLGIYIYGLTIGMHFDELTRILTGPVGNLCFSLLNGSIFQNGVRFTDMRNIRTFFENPERYIEAFDTWEEYTRSPLNAFRDLVKKDPEMEMYLKDRNGNMLDLDDNFGLKEFLLNLFKSRMPISQKIAIIERYRMLYQLENESQTNKYIFQLLLTFLEKTMEQFDTIAANPNDWDAVVKLSKGAEELRQGGQMFSLNQGVKGKPDKYISQLENIQYFIINAIKEHNKSLPKKLRIEIQEEFFIDISKLAFDPEARRKYIELYDRFKVSVNYLDAMVHNPHTFAYLQDLAIAYSAHKKSFKFRNTESLAYLLRLNEGIFQARKGVENFLNSYMINMFLLTEPTVTIPKGHRTTYGKLGVDTVMRLGTTDGNAAFRSFVEQTIIPDLINGVIDPSGVSASYIKDNLFILNLALTSNNRTVSHNANAFYSTLVNMLPRENNERILFDQIKTAFNRIANTKYTWETTAYDESGESYPQRHELSLVDIFTYYTMIANENKLAEDSLVSILEDFSQVGARGRFFKFEDYLDRMEIDLSYDEVFKDLIYYVAPRESLWTAKSKYNYAFDRQEGKYRLFKKLEKSDIPEEFDDMADLFMDEEFTSSVINGYEPYGMVSTKFIHAPISYTNAAKSITINGEPKWYKIDPQTLEVTANFEVNEETRQAIKSLDKLMDGTLDIEQIEVLLRNQC